MAGEVSLVPAGSGVTSFLDTEMKPGRGAVPCDWHGCDVESNCALIIKTLYQLGNPEKPRANVSLGGQGVSTVRQQTPGPVSRDVLRVRPAAPKLSHQIRRAGCQGWRPKGEVERAVQTGKKEKLKARSGRAANRK